jgi:ABC-2 type transport system permease protein
VYVYGGEDLVGGAFAVVVETLADALASGEIAVRTTVSALQKQPRTRALLRAGALNDALADLAVTAVLPTSNPVRIRRVALEGQPPGISLAHYVAVAIAIMFSGLTALLGCASLYQEKAQRTLQRTYLTPTPPWVVLGAQALATYALGVAQMLVLVGSLAALEAAAGHGQARVGRLDLLGLGGLALAEVAAATGLGVVIAGLCGSYARAANYGRAALVLMGLVGGIFFPANLLPAPWTWLSRALYQYWAMDGYLRLARGGEAASVLMHMLVMAGMGALFLAIGSALVRRRLAYG